MASQQRSESQSGHCDEKGEMRTTSKYSMAGNTYIVSKTKLMMSPEAAPVTVLGEKLNELDGAT